MLSALYRKLFLRGVQREAVKAGLSLLDALLVLVDARYEDTGAGRQIVGSTVSGQSLQFAIPAGAGFSAVSVAEAIEDLIERYYGAIVELGGSPTDDAIVAKMIDRLDRVQTVSSRYINLRMRATVT